MKLRVSSVQNIWVRRAVVVLTLPALLVIAALLGALSFSSDLLGTAVDVCRRNCEP